MDSEERDHRVLRHMGERGSVLYRKKTGQMPKDILKGFTPFRVRGFDPEVSVYNKDKIVVDVKDKSKKK